jgi:heme exporter protein C
MRNWLRPALAAVAFAMLGVGAWLGLSWAPPDREMGDVQRIMYAHVPAVWMALLAVSLNFACSITYLFKNTWKADALAEASAEVGVLFGAVGVSLGAIWARPTWGVWWTWDPRLTTAAIMLVSYAGYLALRRFVEDPERRAVWSAVVAIIAYVDVPIIWYSVKWWKSLHQVQSSPKTVDPQMTFVLRWNAFALLAFLIFFIWSRYRIALREREREVALPDALPSGQTGQMETSGAVR